MVDCMSTSPHSWTVFSHAGCVSCPTLSRMQPLCLWQHVDEELMCKLEMDQSSRFRNRDANVAVSFPFLSSMRPENVSKMVRLVGGPLPKGAIAPLSLSKSMSAPLQNLVHLHSKIWCIPLSKIPSYSLPKSGHLFSQQSRVSFQKSDHLSLPKKVQPSELLLSSSRIC
uniref:Uncharacterized protein n=1 Tax=Vitis vinifera TaxID=29760 RepID=A5AM24_VITVI|nr:hypothetical protein VITISV_003213 [Vitis vinifera]